MKAFTIGLCDPVQVQRFFDDRDNRDDLRRLELKTGDYFVIAENALAVRTRRRPDIPALRARLEILKSLFSRNLSGP